MRCPRCGTEVADGASRCPACQAHLPSSAPAAGPAPASGDEPATALFVPARGEEPTGAGLGPSDPTEPPAPGGPVIRQVARPADKGPLEVGHQFSPRYIIVRLLGIGGMGAVY